MRGPGVRCSLIPFISISNPTSPSIPIPTIPIPPTYPFAPQQHISSFKMISNAPLHPSHFHPLSALPWKLASSFVEHNVYINSRPVAATAIGPIIIHALCSSIGNHWWSLARTTPLRTFQSFPSPPGWLIAPPCEEVHLVVTQA